MNKPAVSQAKMDRMRRAIERGGHRFRGFRTLPDGSVEALVGEPGALTPANQIGPSSDSSDDEFGEWAKTHGYG